MGDHLTDAIRKMSGHYEPPYDTVDDVAVLKAEVERLKAELQLVTSPHESVGAVMRKREREAWQVAIDWAAWHPRDLDDWEDQAEAERNERYPEVK